MVNIIDLASPLENPGGMGVRIDAWYETKEIKKQE